MDIGDDQVGQQQGTRRQRRLRRQTTVASKTTRGENGRHFIQDGLT